MQGFSLMREKIIKKNNFVEDYFVLQTFLCEM
jgi:hypothetical protein